MRPITDGILALDVYRALGMSRDAINLTLNARWYSEDGLVHPEEWRTYCRHKAAESLRASRGARSRGNDTLGDSLIKMYKSWKEAANEAYD